MARDELLQATRELFAKLASGTLRVRIDEKFYDTQVITNGIN